MNQFRHPVSRWIIDRELTDNEVYFLDSIFNMLISDNYTVYSRYDWHGGEGSKRTRRGTLNGEPKDGKARYVLTDFYADSAIDSIYSKTEIVSYEEIIECITKHIIL